jgi:hypothetical protein
MTIPSYCQSTITAQNSYRSSSNTLAHKIVLSSFSGHAIMFTDIHHSLNRDDNMRGLSSVLFTFGYSCLAVYGNGQIPVSNPLTTSFSCPGLPTVHMSGSVVTAPLPVSSAAPGDPIKSLAVRLTTSGDLLSGTNDDVWLDIGPKAWKIGSDFDKGSTRTISIDLTTRDDNVDVPSVVPLYVRDITRVRLEKKGLCGLTDAPDSVAGLVLPAIPTPAETIAALKQQVVLAQYALDQQQAALDLQQKLLDQQVQAISIAQQTISSAENELATIPGQIANIQNQLTSLQKQLLQTPANVTQRACSTVSTPGRVILGVLTGGTSELVCRTVTVVNPVWQSLTNTAASLTQSKDSLAAELQAAGIRKAAALQSLSTATAAKAATELQKQKDLLQYQAAHSALDGAQNALADAEAIAAKLPIPNASLPTPGQWKVQHLTLIVNGHDFASFEIDQTLKQRHAEWSSPIGTQSPAEQFVNSLRVNVNKPSTVADERVARVTTIFKLNDISGWKGGPVSSARVVGVLRNPPSAGDDGYVSLDLELERAEVGNYAFVLDGNGGVGHKRFIRVEYKNRASNGSVDARYKSWQVGTRLAIEGPVAWDTDRQGFFELHPDSQSQISPLAANDSGATPNLVLWWRRLTQ